MLNPDLDDELRRQAFELAEALAARAPPMLHDGSSASESTTTSRGLGVELVHLKRLAELAELADEVVATSWRSQRRGPTLAPRLTRISPL